MTIDRRQLLAGGGLLYLAAATPVASAPARSAARGFGLSDVSAMARRLSDRLFIPPPQDLPPGLKALDYDGYRRIQFRHDRALWAHDGLKFRAEVFHRGNLFTQKVELYEVRDGKPEPILYSPDFFQYDPPLKDALPPDIGFAGFRLEAPGTPGMDEIAAFLGASYFRSLGAHQRYGLSARGLAIGTGSPAGEEFPVFRAWWIVRPQPQDETITVYGLLDSHSVTGAYEFHITPGAVTRFDVACRLFPRVTLDRVGIAPLTSMYLYGPDTRARFDDFRPAVHDSDGLRMTTGVGQAIWRPLRNPMTVQESAFADPGVHAFGLMQRETRFDAYEDTEARYDLRPSALVEPSGEWGPGHVHLFELPSNTEAADNIVAFWRPKAPLDAGRMHAFDYSLLWGQPGEGQGAQPKLRVARTHSGRAPEGDGRLFVIDYEGDAAPDAGRFTAAVRVSAGEAGPVRFTALDDRRIRAAFRFIPPAATAADITLDITGPDSLPNGLIAETWTYRWTA
ncbi:glucan biosynthesis protein G [Asticcacaulis solisilvae]|uniref:glucan biosynthesis protein G n=1 Tax=Asticcacaulis solisilvae TaxID=1217274 RepID=UPI003FD75B43